MSSLPHNLYRGADVREMDRLAIETLGIPGAQLMERAGAAAFDYLRARWPRAQRIRVLCGGGNNGGDGYVVARLAVEAGLEAAVLQVGDAERIGGEARVARERALQGGVPVQAWPASLDGADLLVDGLLGTGLNGEVHGPFAEAIAAINAAPLPVLALDIPSGLHADSGAVLGAAVNAEATITFIALKAGLFTAEGPACCGELRFDGLDVPESVSARFVPAAHRLCLSAYRHRLAPRRRSAHKGDNGHVLVVGGELGFSGAARMAAEAAARVGAGLVSVATRAAHAAVLNLGRPELMCHGVERREALEPLLARASVVAVGPGLGQGAWGRALLGRLLESRLPLVVDADALNLLASEPTRRDEWVLTPHPGEAARLLGISVAEVQHERLAAAAAIRQRYGGSCILKGAGSVVETPAGPPGICGAGNPGMASGGMGDVLTGILAGLLAQGIPASDAAPLAVCLHGAAAEAAAREGERGLLASDLFGPLRRLVNPVLK